MCRYKDALFAIKNIHFSGKCKSIMDILKDDMNITLECVSRGEHVPDVERNNRTIKERYRAHYHILPFKSIPNIMVRYHSNMLMRQLNYFPVEGVISKYHSPHMILKKNNMYYKTL